MLQKNMNNANKICDFGNADEVICESLVFSEIYGNEKIVAELRSSESFDIYLVTTGSGIHQVLNIDIPCASGDICIIPSGIPHGFFVSEPGSSLLVRRISFFPDSWLSGKYVDKNTQDYCYGVLKDNRVIAYATLNSEMVSTVSTLFNLIESENRNRESQWREMVRGYLSNLLISVNRYVNCTIKNVSFVSAGEWRAVSSAISIVKSEYENPELTLSGIAKRSFLSASQLSRVFSKIMGESFADYLLSERIKRVCELLIKSDMKVEDIANSCGFRSLPSFYKNFTASVGMTPKEYKASHTVANNQSKEYQALLKGEKIMSILAEISENIQIGKAKIVKELVAKALEEGVKPEDILKEGLLHGMGIVGEKFKNNEVYVPEVLVAARAMNMGTAILKPYIKNAEGLICGKVCIGTVLGDLHDIGKNLVKMMMEGKGLEVIDLGTDVPAETFVKTAIEEKCDVICCSALLTTTMHVMEDVINAAEAAGIRDKVKIMIGGAPVSQEFCDKIGADCYTVDAASAADAAAEFCKNKA